jgi:pimeloyl-ACP methyl ester carboxylesterase
VITRVVTVSWFLVCSPLLGGERDATTIPADDGVAIAYTSQGQGEPAIVFIHGWTCDRSHWRFQVPEFRKSHRVITIDLPGHGASGSNRESWSIAGLGADVAAVVRGLKLKKVILVGHSMGGPVALAAAAKLHGIALGVVAVDALHNVEFSYPKEVVERMVKRFEDDFEAARTGFMTAFFKNPDSEILASIVQHHRLNQEAAIALLRDLNRLDLKGALVAARVPVRAINAAAPFPTAVEINRKHGDFDAVLMPDVGHFLMLERPVEFNRHLRTLIDRLRSSSTPP